MSSYSSFKQSFLYKILLFYFHNLVPSPTSPATSASLFSGYSHRKTLWNTAQSLNVSSPLPDLGDKNPWAQHCYVNMSTFFYVHDRRKIIVFCANFPVYGPSNQRSRRKMVCEVIAVDSKIQLAVTVELAFPSLSSTSSDVSTSVSETGAKATNAAVML